MRVALLLALALQAAAAPAAFDSGRAWEHLRQLVALGPRPAGSPAIDQARAYIKAQLAASGVTVAEQVWTDQTPAGPIRMVNLIATLPGASKNRLIIGGHYDTKRFREFRFVGANDGGSSAAFLIELARVLKNRKNALTIELLFLDGEEAVVEWAGTDNTYGSRHYVATARKDGSLATAKAFVLVDMIGDRNLQLTRETNSTPWLDGIIRGAANTQKLGTYFAGPPMALEDDHLPFLAAGVPSVDLIDFDFPAWQTAADTLDAVSARSLQIVGDVLLAALPPIEAKLK
jgi:Zn-dependent M28 family amino/carboxypeptidase